MHVRKGAGHQQGSAQGPGHHLHCRAVPETAAIIKQNLCCLTWQKSSLVHVARASPFVPCLCDYSQKGDEHSWYPGMGFQCCPAHIHPMPADECVGIGPPVAPDSCSGQPSLASPGSSRGSQGVSWASHSRKPQLFCTTARQASHPVGFALFPFPQDVASLSSRRVTWT